MSRDQERELWMSDETFAAPLVLLVVDRLTDPDDDADGNPLAWDFDTLKIEIEKQWGVQPTQLTLDRAMMGIAIVQAPDRFFNNVPDFIVMCSVLSGAAFDPTVFTPPTSLEIAWGITELLFLVSHGQPVKFGAQVQAFVGAILEDEGVIDPPDVLGIAYRADAWDAITKSHAHNPLEIGIIREVQQEKSNEIKRTIRDSLARLIAQIESLELENGDSREFAKLMSERLDTSSSHAHQD